jgi:hypothetical protein
VRGGASREKGSAVRQEERQGRTGRKGRTWGKERKGRPEERRVQEESEEERRRKC